MSTGSTASPFTVVARLRSRPGRADELRAALDELVVHSRQEPGCLDYDLHVGLDDPDLFVFYENWVDREAHHEHDRTPHIARFREVAADLLDGQPQVDALQRAE